MGKNRGTDNNVLQKDIQQCRDEIKELSNRLYILQERMDSFEKTYKDVNNNDDNINNADSTDIGKSGEACDHNESFVPRSIKNIKEYIGEIKSKPNNTWTEREFNMLLRAQRLRLADPFPFYASKIT